MSTIAEFTRQTPVEQPTDLPVFYCPCCGVKMHVASQPFPAKYNRPALLFITCWEPGCDFKDYTVDEETLLHKLAKYGVTPRYCIYTGKAVSR